MGAGRSYSMDEVGGTQSSAKMAEHRKTIQRFIDKGYEIESQEPEEEEGLGNELITKTLVTVLKPPMSQMPYIKFEAKEIFGHYNYEDQVFDEYEFPKFDLKTYKRGAGLNNFNDPWDIFDGF